MSEAPKTCVTPEFRASFANVFVAKAQKDDDGNDGEAKFGITMLFPKDADLSGMKALAQAAVIEKWGTDPNKWPKPLRTPFRDQGEKEFDGFVPGAVFCNATSKQKPGVVDQNVHDIIDQTQFYSGCYARASIRAFTYDKRGNRGVAFGLSNVQKTRDGDPLGGRTRPQDDFEPVAGADAGAGSAAPAGAAAALFG